MTSEAKVEAALSVGSTPMIARHQGVIRVLRCLFLTLLPAWWNEFELCWRTRNSRYNVWYFRTTLAPQTLEQCLQLQPAIRSLQKVTVEAVDAIEHEDGELRGDA